MCSGRTGCIACFATPDNGLEFCGRAMLTWAHDRGVSLRLIEPGKPNQNAYIESFNGRWACARLVNQCSFRHSSRRRAQVVIEAWRREYNEERPKKGLGGLTPAAYAERLIKETSTVTAGLKKGICYSTRGDVDGPPRPRRQHGLRN